MKSWCGTMVVCAAVLAAGLTAQGGEPSVNLGFTSFLDGIPPAGDGWYYQEYVQYYASKRFVDDSGDRLPLPGPDLEALVFLTQCIWQPGKSCPVTRGKVGLDVIVPWVSLNLDYEDIDKPYAGVPRANEAGFGDILVGPYLQWVHMRNGKPFLAHRIELQCLLPTGDYDDNRQLNPGANHFSFNPYWAGTLFLGPKASVSARLHYLWNDTNDDPVAGDMSPSDPEVPAEETRAGDAVHANFAASYQVVDKMLRLGINGYFLRQISESEIDGTDIEDSEEQVLGIGPGALVSFSQNTHLFLNVYFESEVENRPVGERYSARFVHHF